jgi:hypothetical protein
MFIAIAPGAAVRIHEAETEGKLPPPHVVLPGLE